MRDCPYFACKRGKVKKYLPSAPEGGASKRNCFYPLRARGTNPDDDDVGKSCNFCFSYMSSL